MIKTNTITCPECHLNIEVCADGDLDIMCHHCNGNIAVKNTTDKPVSIKQVYLDFTWQWVFCSFNGDPNLTSCLVCGSDSFTIKDSLMCCDACGFDFDTKKQPLGHILKAQRKHHNITVKDLAAKTGYALNTINQNESSNSPSWSYRQKFYAVIKEEKVYA